MGEKIVILIICGILLFIVIKWLLSFRIKKNDIVVLVSGKLGGGKTFTAVNDVVNDYYKSCKEWKKINKPCFIRKLYTLDFIPYFKNKRLKNELYGLSKPLIYSNFPICLNKKKNIYSVPINNDIMLLKKSIPLNSIVIIDEFSSWVNQFQFNEKFSVSLNDHIQKWRHYHGNYSRLYVIDQSSDNIPLQVKRRCNKVLYCEKVKHYLGFIHILYYKYIELTENIKTIEINNERDIDNSNKADSDDKTSKRLIFSIKKYYDSRAYSNRYTYVVDALECNNAKYIDSKLKCNIVMSTPKEKGVNLSELIESKGDINDEKKVNN